MDPLSITTSCIALISVVGGCTRSITTFVTNVRDARQELMAMSRELADLDMTLHILKDDTAAAGKPQLPESLRRRICDIIENCNAVLIELRSLLQKYEGAGIDRSAKWVLTGRKDAEKIYNSIKTHKAALSLVIEATTLHVTQEAATEAKKASQDTALLKEYTMKIVERLAQQDEILEQIAWIKAVISQRPTNTVENSRVMEEYLDTISDYAESACGNSVTDDAANEMNRLSLESTADLNDASSQTSVTLLEPSPFVTEEGPDAMTILLGNTHRLVEPDEARPDNKHLWTFYLQLSGEEIVDRVKIYLHRTFVQPELTFSHGPYRITRIGWGYFEIRVKITLKPGFRWQKSNDRVLDIYWDLEFDGIGDSAYETHAVLVDNVA